VASIALAFRAAVRWWPYPPNVNRAPAACTWIEDRNCVPLAAFASSSGDWHLPLTMDQISQHLLDAIVAVEDSRFYEHHGVDWRSAVGSLWQDAMTLSLHRGASTLTMQLYRLRDPAPRSLVAKIVQAVRACQIERAETKRQILIDYLNRAPFGANLVGAGAASWRYFGRPCRELSLGQAALLAGLPQSPNRFRPDRFPDRARARRDHVLDRMLACGMISDAQRREAGQEPIDVVWRGLPQDLFDAEKTPNALMPSLARLAREHPGETIRTTIDAATQRQAEAATHSMLASLRDSKVAAAAVVVLDTVSGECLASVSCCTDAESKDVDFTVRPRSSGSTLKPFIYAAAFDAGICSPATLLDDSPAAWAGGYEPANYDRDFRGPMTAAEALAQSRNVPALVLLSKVGVQRAVEVMRGMGLETLAKTPQRYGLPLAIGGAEVTAMELAEAYATIARGSGPLRCKTLMRRCEMELTPPPLPSPGVPGEGGRTPLRRASCLEVLHCLADLERTHEVCPAAATMAPAWKTGTSSGHRDAWCAAVTPRRTVVVWLGNPDGSGSDKLVGQEAAAPLALQILAAEDCVEGEGFAPPSGFAVAGANAGELKTSADALAMLSPTAGQEIVADAGIAAERQRFPLRARAAGALWWFVDGDCVGEVSGDATLWWTPVTGTHEVRVVDRAGHAMAAAVLVR
jgi:penicillin-binding protein 1C